MRSIGKVSLKILFVAADVRLTEQDGQAIHTISICRALSELGNDVLLLVADPRSPNPIPAKVKCVGIRNLGTQATRDVLNWARRWNPDVIYERRSTPKLGGRVSSRLGIPYYLEINGLAEIERQGSSSLLRTMGRWRRGTFKKCTRIFVPSARLGHVISETYAIPIEKFIIVPNGVDLLEFQPLDKSTARDRLGWSAECRAVLFVGKLVPWQGLDSLLLATKEISTVRNLKVFIVGDGPLSGSLARAIQSKGLEDLVKLVGSIPHSEVPTWIAASDLCVAPFSRNRNQVIGLSPLKLFEYMAMGRPIITTDVPGVREVVGKAAIIVPPDSVGALARAMEEALSSSKQLESLGEEGRRLAQGCSWHERATGIMQALQADGVHARGTVR